MTARLKQGGRQIVTNYYPHTWPYLLSCLPDSPFRDLRVRKAVNVAIDREGLVDMLGGTAIAARGMAPPNDPWFGRPGFGSADPTSLIDGSWSRRVPPAGFNWGWFNDPVVDALAAKAEVEFEPEKQNKVLAELHAAIVDNAMWAFVVHDMNPRALAPNVKGFVQAQSWFQDLTPVYLA